MSLRSKTIFQIFNICFEPAGERPSQDRLYYCRNPLLIHRKPAFAESFLKNLPQLDSVDSSLYPTLWSITSACPHGTGSSLQRRR
jgi:hypothetical protein